MGVSGKAFFASGVILIALFAAMLFPYRRSLFHILTRDVYAKKTCAQPAKVPTLKLRNVNECEDPMSDPRFLREPCVVRGAVTKEKVQEFVDGILDEKWVMRHLANTSDIGHPFMESRSMISEGRVSCSLQDLINNEPRCVGTYTGFKELNFSNHLPLQNDKFNLEKFQRTDTFLGNLETAKVTASFHSNNFEASGALQIVGEKIWLMMSPNSFFKNIEAYSIGAYNAAFSTCVEDLEGIDLQAIWTQPGDYIRFPKAWTHQIYTLPGPNFMINFRNFVFYPWQILDLISLLAAANANHFVNHCDASDTAPTNYGIGHPTLQRMYQFMLKYDMRCTDMLNEEIKKYKGLVKDVTSDSSADEGILDQLKSFLSVP